MTARRSWRTPAASVDFAGPARRIGRWLAKQESQRFCAPEKSPLAKGRHLTVDERGYLVMLASDHLCRHTGTSPVGPCNAEPCQARGAAYALLEVVYFEDDEHSAELGAARDLFVGLDVLWSSLERAEGELRTYLGRVSQRHEKSWAKARSHDHKETCIIPADLLLRLARWKEMTAAVQGRSVLSQFRSLTTRGRKGEGLRPTLPSTVEAILRRDGWKLREILSVVGGLVPGDGDYDHEFENLKKRLAGVRKVEPEPAAITAPSSPAPSTADPSPTGVARGDGFANAATSVGAAGKSAPPSDGFATGKVTGEVMGSATGGSPARGAMPGNDPASAEAPPEDPI